MAVSLQDARKQLNDASGGSNNNEWLNSRSDDDVRSQYKTLTGQDVEGAAGPPPAGTTPGPAGDVAGGYQFLPFLMQLLQMSIHSGQFEKQFGLQSDEFKNTVEQANKQFELSQRQQDINRQQFQQQFGLNLGSQTGYAPTAGMTEDQTASAYDKSMAWYKGFKDRTGRAPTRAEWINGVQASAGMSAEQAAYVYDKGVGAYGVPNKDQFTQLTRQGTGLTPTLQRQQFESDLALKLAELDRTNPYAARQARLGLSPGLEQGAADIFRRLQGQSALPQFGNAASSVPTRNVPPPDYGKGGDRMIGPPGYDPSQIAYAGGTPYFDERTGQYLPGHGPGDNVPQPTIPQGGWQIDYGRLRNLLPSELESVATDLRAKGINPEDYFAEAKRALPTGAPGLEHTQYI